MVRMALNAYLDRLVGDRLCTREPLDDHSGARVESKMLGETKGVREVLSYLRSGLRNNENQTVPLSEPGHFRRVQATRSPAGSATAWSSARRLTRTAASAARCRSPSGSA